MIEFLSWLLVFGFGMATGATLAISYGLHQVKKMKKSKQQLLEDIKKKAQELDQKTTSIKERLVKATQIAQTQQELRAQIEMPSKNGLHSKYKNGLMTEIGELEQEKIDILRTILAEGFTPMITVIQDSGHREDVPLSEYIVTAQNDVDVMTGNKSEPLSTEPMAPPVGTNEPRQVGKFFVYKGGKDDGTTH